MQAVNPAGASVYEKPNTANLGTQSRNAAAELEAIISSRTGSVRALPTLTSSPALLVGQLGWGTAGSSGGARHKQQPISTRRVLPWRLALKLVFQQELAVLPSGGDRLALGD